MYDVVGGNHDLEGIDEFQTDAANLKAYLDILGKETPQFCHEVAPKVLVLGMGSTAFRTTTYTSHEVSIDKAQLDWFVKTVQAHPEEDGWTIFVFTHAPIIGSALRVLQVSVCSRLLRLSCDSPSKENNIRDSVTSRWSERREQQLAKKEWAGMRRDGLVTHPPVVCFPLNLRHRNATLSMAAAG